MNPRLERRPGARPVCRVAGVVVLMLVMSTLWMSVAGCTPDAPVTLRGITASSERLVDTGAASSRECMDALGNGEWSFTDRRDLRLSSIAADKSLLLCGRAVARSLVLANLANTLSVEVLHADRVEGELNGWILGETPEQVLLQLLRGQQLSFGYEPDGNTHRLANIAVARAPPNSGHSPVSAELSESAAAVAADADTNNILLPVTESTAQFDAALYARWQVDYGHVEPLLIHPDAAMRLQAINEIAAEGAGLQVLDRAFASEKDPAVRIELLRKLDESGSVIALQSMLGALADSDAGVVVESIELIADWQDLEVVERYVQPLLTHASSDVRESAQTAIDRFRQ